MFSTYKENLVLLRHYHQMTFKYIENRKVIEKSDIVIEIIWFTHESPVLKPDWLGVIKLFRIKNSDIGLYSNLSSTLPEIDNKNFGR